MARHVNADAITCVNDPYDLEMNTKDNDRDMRIQDQKLIPNVFMKSNDKLPSSRDFRTMLCNAGHKKRVQNFINIQSMVYFKSASQKVVYSAGEECIELTDGATCNELGFLWSRYNYVQNLFIIEIIW